MSIKFTHYGMLLSSLSSLGRRPLLMSKNLGVGASTSELTTSLPAGAALMATSHAIISGLVRLWF